MAGDEQGGEHVLARIAGFSGWLRGDRTLQLSPCPKHGATSAAALSPLLSIPSLAVENRGAAHPGPDSRRPLRVALVTETYLPQINGVSRTLFQLVEHLLAGGDQVLILGPHYDEPAPPQATQRSTWHGWRLPFYREVVLPLASPRRLRRTLRDFAPDVVHIATEGPLGWSALCACRSLGLPTVSSFHTLFPSYLPAYGLGCLEALAWRYLRWFHNATAMTFCTTPSLRTMLEERGFERLQVWSRGVDTKLFHPGLRDADLRRQWGIADDEVVVTYVGRLAAEKNLAELLQAWRAVPADARLRLVLVGDGPLRPALEAAADRRVIFAGYRQGEDLARHYAAADLFVFPSRTDTFGNVLLEAMASGLPAIAFDVPGPRDIIQHQRTGLIVAEPGAAALAAALLQAAGEPERRMWSAAARRHAEGQSWFHILERVREQYHYLGRPVGPAVDGSRHVG